MTNYDMLWASNPNWWGYADEEATTFYIKDNAPDEAKTSFARFQEQMKKKEQKAS